jgi:hypothetical protein
LWDNVEEYGGGRKATNDNTVWRMRIAYRLNMATCASNPTRKRINFLLFHGNNGFVNPPQSYVIRLLPVFLTFLPVLYRTYWYGFLSVLKTFIASCLTHIIATKFTYSWQIFTLYYLIAYDLLHVSARVSHLQGNSCIKKFEFYIWGKKQSRTQSKLMLYISLVSITLHVSASF